MHYQEVSIVDFFSQINSEERARKLVWRHKFSGKEFNCPVCQSEVYYQYKTRPEIRKCKRCRTQVRLRAETIFENSKVPILIWVRLIFLCMSGKRGVSALEAQKHLKCSSYGVVWGLLQKVRVALGKRDEHYKLKEIVELDSTFFGKRSTKNQKEVLVAVESKEFTSAKSNKIKKAGFAKVVVATENKAQVTNFIKNNTASLGEVHTDGARSYLHTPADLKIVSVSTHNDHVLNESWLPWVHRFISNAKTWILGTHHGVTGKYVHLYLKEYTYRFNRRHDAKRLFDRALFACTQSQPISLGALCG